MPLLERVEYERKLVLLWFGNGMWATLANEGDETEDKYGEMVLPLLVIPSDEIKYVYQLRERQELNVQTPRGHWAQWKEYKKSEIVPLSPWSAVQPVVFVLSTYEGKPTAMTYLYKKYLDYISVLQQTVYGKSAIIASLSQEVKNLEVHMRQRLKEKAETVAMVSYEPMSKDEDETDQQNYSKGEQ